jgi:ubiquinone/menaquinone biosynthesis C-methylase UbiE
MSRWGRKRTVMRRYDLTAQTYDQRYAEEQEAKYRTALESLRIGASSVVLDVGCGTGLFFSHAAANAETVVGVDISHGLLLQARDRAKEYGNVHVVQADADHLPFKNALFDFVFVFTVLQNMPKPAETLREVSRTARREASIVATGLKRAIPLKAFEELLRSAELRVVSLRDDEALKCYVVVSVQGEK